MILCGIENCNQDTYNPFGVGSVRERLVRVWYDGATGQKGACQVADGRYDDGEIVATVPEAIVGRLVTEDLDGLAKDVFSK